MASNISGPGIQFLSGLAGIQAGINQAQQEVSSGLKVSVASDAPDEVSTVLQLHANIAANAQLTENLSSLESSVGTADSSLSTAATLLDQASTLTTEGLSLTATATSRATIASQIQGIMQQMVGISQTTFEGQYIFSGDAAQTPLYQYDTATQTITQLGVSAATQQIAGVSGQTFPVALSANQIFDATDPTTGLPTTGNVFAALTAVSTALTANDTTGLNTAAGSLQTASAYLDEQQSFYGNVENQITAAQTEASAQNVSLQQTLGTLVDANEASAIVQLQQGSTDLQAAMAAYSKIPQTTLFDSMNP